jgi:hypothetical protein
MNHILRTVGTLKNHVCGRWRQACLRQATQLNCNPLGIILGLAVMVGTVEIWGHSGDAGMWIVLLAGSAAAVAIALMIVRLLRPMVIVSPPSRRQRPAAQKRPVPVPAPRPAPGSVLAAGPDRAERLGEPERIKEPV